MKKALRKLIPAMVMLLIAAAFVGTSTFAWFSMNRVVNVSGMSVNTTVSDSLSIAATNTEADFATSLTQTVSGSLRPVSTVNGATFFYTDGANNVKGNGSVISAADNKYVAYNESSNLTNTGANKTNYDATFQTTYAVTGTITTSNVVYGYVDYVFYIKATNVTGSDEDLKLTKLNLLYNDTQVPATEKAWRVAVFAQQVNAGAAGSGDGTLKAILARDSATNFTSGKAVAAATGTVLGDVPTPTSGWAVDSIAAGETEYNKVVVRLWLEGEDNTCTNSTFANLTEDYTLDLAFALGGEENAVTVIGSAVPSNS